MKAEQTDPMQRLALVTAYEALEMAGVVPNRTPSSNSKRIGTFYGQASDDYREVNANQNVSTYGIPGTERAFGNGRINYFFKFGGPSFNLDTACSSGLAAVHAACTSLWAGDSDLVIAGGLNVITNPDIYCMLTKGHFLSKTGQCKVWDKDADGYCRSDGIGSVVIKRLEDAIADNDNILATIVAGATNHSCDAISITHPHVDNQKDNYHEVLFQAGVNPLDVSHVELHGTGTQAGDAVESQSVLETFAPLIPRRRPDQRLTLGALKSNIGHGEAAAGVASLIKVLLMYQKNQIPRHIGIRGEINPVVAKHLHNRNAGLVFETTPWHKPEGGKRLAIVNSFGAHGGNTTLLLEDAPEKPDSGASRIDHFKTHIVAISAKSKASLRGNIKDLLEYLDQEPVATNLLANLSYTTVARRIHHPRRIARAISSVGQLRDFLRASIEVSDDVRPSSASNSNIVFAFTGQGSFYVGVGQQLYRHFPGFQIQVQQLDRIMQRLGFSSVLPVIDGEASEVERSTLSPIVSQLTILILQISLIRFWRLLGIKPDAVIGHSLGEYAALVAAGVLSVADSIYLVGERAKLLEKYSEPSTHGMLSVRADAATIRRVVEDRVHYELSCLNTSEDTVVSGPRGDIDRIRAILEAEGLKCLSLDIPYAFHSAQLDPILDDYEKIASHVSFKPPEIPVISPLLAQCIFDGKAISAKYLRRASREPVNFAGALQASEAAGIIDDKTIWLELGPHPVCSSFARSQLPNIKALPSLKKNEDNFTTIANTLAMFHVAGLNVNWNEYYRPFEKSFNLLHLKHYHWNDNDYFIPYTGIWTLEKAHHTKEKPTSTLALAPSVSTLQTSSVQRVICRRCIQFNCQFSSNH
ncbi:hypothetical protein LTR84_008140 [Exophiala bonariae]|uniref:Ketosynthase family 3 (KS3) domain-containing protein n=1 Tax=Exophiala bonariae TaxID=1690606 RepID=A0AAV9NM16_9EURO|nr:hypothetical protein LTR84_008140 [Exophiala bonariae]